MLPTKNSLAVIEEDVSMVVGISTLRPIGCMRSPTLIVCDDCNRVPSLAETINCCGIVTIGVNAECTEVADMAKFKPLILAFLFTEERADHADLVTYTKLLIKSTAFTFPA